MPRAPRAATVPPLDQMPPLPPPDPAYTFVPYDQLSAELEEDGGDALPLEDARFRDWSWYVYRLREPGEPMGTARSARVLVTKLVGPIDLSRFMSEFGGGVFEFWGYFEGKLRKKLRQAIEGAIRTYTPAPPPPAPFQPAAALPAPIRDSEAERRLERIERALEKLSERNVSTPQGLTIEQVLQLLPRLSGGGGDPTALMAAYTDAFQQGMKLRELAGGAADKSDIQVVLETVGPSIERLVGAFAANFASKRAAAQSTAAAHASRATQSKVEVVEDPPASEPAPAPAPAAPADGFDGQHRWMTAIESLARDIAEGADPADCAVTIERILQPRELDPLLASTTDQVLEQLGAFALQYPALSSPQAAPFVDAVLRELRSPSAAE